MSSAALTPSARTLRIVHACTPASVGGLERVVQGLATGLAARGHMIDVIAVVDPAARTSDFRAPLEAAGVRVHEIRLGGRDYLGDLRVVGALLRRLEPDVLHTHGYRSDIIHGLLVRPGRSANVSTLHGSSRLGGLSHVFEWIQERVLRRFDGVVAVSSPLERQLLALGVPAPALHLIPNATQSPQTLPRAEARAALGIVGTESTIGFIGRLVSIKGTDVLLRALATVSELLWNAVIVGGGPERERLESLAVSLGLGARVRFTGEREHAARYLAAFDLFVLPSRSEGTPIVLLETLATAVPVIASEVGGVPDLISSPEEGTLVPPDDPAALGTAIRAVLTSPETARVAAKRAQDRVRRDYDFETWISRHEALYVAAIQRRMDK